MLVVGLDLNRGQSSLDIAQIWILDGESISSNDCICLACYKAQLAMVKSHEQAYQLHDKTSIWETIISDSSTDNTIRAIVTDRITCEQDRMPSHTSMWRHWLRSCWIAQMWSNAPKEDVQHSLPQPELCGWTKNNDGSYVFDWECPSVQKLVKETITFLTRHSIEHCTPHADGAWLTELGWSQ